MGAAVFPVQVGEERLRNHKDLPQGLSIRTCHENLQTETLLDLTLPGRPYQGESRICEKPFSLNRGQQSVALGRLNEKNSP